ncbi:MAG: AmmeMemoRadiSam system protein B [candidate division WOR-3 bacterium]
MRTRSSIVTVTAVASGRSSPAVEMGKLVLVAVVGFYSACSGRQEARMVREPAVAGQFYPADCTNLGAMVDAMLADAKGPGLTGKLVALQVPHAGYVYSGSTAAHAFRLLQGLDSLTVVMLGPSHQQFIDRAAVYSRGSWRTPLGEVRVDEGLAARLLGTDSFFVDMPRAHLREHSLEVQLPFLQRAMRDFRILPIMVSQPSFDQCERAGRALASVCAGQKVILLVSTDLYHGYSYVDARRTDSMTVGLLMRNDPRTLYDALSSGRAQACGGYAAVVMMVAAKELGADQITVLAQTTSGDVTGVREGYCVGYSAAAFVDTDSDGQTLSSDELSVEERESLLRIARQTIEEYIRHGTKPQVSALTPRLAEKRGVFVTLKEHGLLRGCIGYIKSPLPLYLAVQDRAVQSATRDPRFIPLRPEELSEVEIEITVLSPLQPVASSESIVVGKHGVVIEKGPYGAVFLPQVPVEQGWDRETYLAELCRKAGLPRDAWRDRDARLYVFTGQVFAEGARDR